MELDDIYQIKLFSTWNVLIKSVTHNSKHAYNSTFSKQISLKIMHSKIHHSLNLE